MTITDRDTRTARVARLAASKLMLAEHDIQAVAGELLKAAAHAPDLALVEAYALRDEVTALRRRLAILARSVENGDEYLGESGMGPAAE
ncbi:MAG: hypothetical protein V2I24_09210 [Halieaceae bacterium]|jgi:hypothetical protein|nr:hypothetical protein [Halieaceae bacterium]